MDIAKEYEEANADAISVLTEPYYFQGSTKYLEEISKAVKIPILRKDFIIDEMQIYESKIIGADAILLICAILDLNTLKSFIETAEEIGLSVLTEAHNEEEIKKAMQAGAQIIGINNRDLKTFNVDIKRSIELRKYVPEGIIFVSESGISTAEQVKELKANKTDAVLIGETFMKSKNKILELEILRGLRK